MCDGWRIIFVLIIKQAFQSPVTWRYLDKGWRYLWKVSKTQMTKLTLKILFQKNSCADCLPVLKVPSAVGLPVFLLDLEIVWRPVLLLWSIPAVCHAEWARLQDRGCLEVPHCIGMLWQAGSPSQNAESLIQKGRNSPRPSPAVACLLSRLQSNVPQPHRACVPLRIVPHFHQQCRGRTAISAAPPRLSSLARALPWVVRDVGLQPLPEEVLNRRRPFPERMSYLKNLHVRASSCGGFETVSPG